MEIVYFLNIFYIIYPQIALDSAKMEVPVVLDFVAAYQGSVESFVKKKVCLIYDLTH